jgi:hypothetical protein
MNNSQKLLTVGMLALTVGMTSCKDDDNGSSGLGKQDAKIVLEEFNTTTKADLQDLSSANGVEAIQDLFDLTSVDDPFARVATDKKGVRKFFYDRGRKFKSIFTTASSKGRVSADEHFDFDANKGVYEWNAAEEIFEWTGEANIIKIKFPTEGSETNNAELQLTAYSDVEVYDEEFEEYSYAPSEIVASVSVAGQTVASLDLDIDYDEEGFPYAADITFGATPYTASIAFNVSAATKSTISASLKNGNEILFATSITVKYADESKSEESLELAEGFIQLNNLTLKGEIDFAAANNTEVDMNDIYKLSLYDGADKLGRVVFVEEGEEIIPFIRYADGTKEKLEDVLQPVVEELEALADTVEDNG